MVISWFWFCLTSDLMKAVRGQKHPSEAKKGMKELIYWKKIFKKMLHNLKNPLAGPIRFEKQPQDKKLWFLRPPTTSTSLILEPRPKVLISSSWNFWLIFALFVYSVFVGLQIERESHSCKIVTHFGSFFYSQFTCGSPNRMWLTFSQILTYFCVFSQISKSKLNVNY